MQAQTPFQFRLRTILAVMLVTAFLSPWYGQTINNALRSGLSLIQDWAGASSESRRWQQAMFQAETVLDDAEFDDVFIGSPPSTRNRSNDVLSDCCDF